MISNAKVIEVLNEVLNQSFDETTPVDQPLKELGVDSLDLFGVLTELEEVAGKKVPDEQVEHLKTIAQITAFFQD